MKFIRYNGKVGSPARNDAGDWNEGDTKPIGDAWPQEVPERLAKSLVASGCFDLIEKSEPTKRQQKPADPED